MNVAPQGLGGCQRRINQTMCVWVLRQDGDGETRLFNLAAHGAGDKSQTSRALVALKEDPV